MDTSPFLRSMLESKLVELGATEDAVDFVGYLEQLNLLTLLAEEIESRARTPDELLILLAKTCIVATGRKTNRRVAVTDQNGDERDYILRTFNRYRQSTPATNGKRQRQCGIASHQVAACICQHRVFDPNAPSPWEIRLVPEDPPIFLDKHGLVRPRYLRQIEKSLTRLLNHSETPTLFDVVPSADDLAEALEPVVGRAGLDLIDSSLVPDTRLRTLTLMSWAQLVLATANTPPPPLIVEMTLLDPGHWIDGGRVDALRPVQWDGQPVRPDLLEELHQAMSTKPRNMVELIEHLPPAGLTLFFEVWDFKFEVGDAEQNFEELKVEQFREKPLNKHVKQMDRYLSMGCVSVRRGRHLRQTPWHLDFFKCGRLKYVSSHQPPVEHLRVIGQPQRHQFYQNLRDTRKDLEKSAEHRRQALSFIHAIWKKLPEPKPLKFDGLFD